MEGWENKATFRYFDSCSKSKSFKVANEANFEKSFSLSNDVLKQGAKI